MITPLSEKCFLNLMSALNSVKFGCLAGPNSSGKRQTINLLAQVYIFFLGLKFTHSLKIKFDSKIIKGMWSIFERD